MNVYLEKPYSINEIGERLNNEDALFPHNEEVSANHRLFIVCDGVGGSKKGEIASALACESIRSYFKSFIHPQQEFRTDFIKKAVYYTEICFDEYLMENPSSKGMATTLSMLYIAPNGVFIAHAGDCRVYHIRNGKILYQTEDHSLVNSLVKTGRIQPAEAENHPQKKPHKYKCKKNEIFKP